MTVGALKMLWMDRRLTSHRYTCMLIKFGTYYVHDVGISTIIIKVKGEGCLL